jgi:hypothetical protein
MRGWHFLRADMTAGCGNEPPWQVGETRTVEGELVLCGHGYHASTRLLDALKYAPDLTICRVELSGRLKHDTDKSVGRKRRLLWALSVAKSERLLHEFACWVAEDLLRRERKAGREPDPRSWAVVKAKRKWLRGEITREEVEAAMVAAARAAPKATDTAAWTAIWAARTVAWPALRAAEAAGAAPAEMARYERKLRRMVSAVRRTGKEA